MKSDLVGVDIGPKTVKLFENELSKAKPIVSIIVLKELFTCKKLDNMPITRETKINDNVINNNFIELNKPNNFLINNY
jgi:hypothetical protein